MARRVTRVFPIFGVRELDEAMGYYRDKLGFSVAWVWASLARERVSPTIEISCRAGPARWSGRRLSHGRDQTEACMDRGQGPVDPVRGREFGTLSGSSGNRSGRS